MNYELFEHRHRFAAWAAARAAQRAFAEVDVLRAALQATAIVDYLRHSAAADVDETAFDRLHKGWCTDVLEEHWNVTPNRAVATRARAL